MKSILAALLLIPALAFAQVTTNPSVTGVVVAGQMQGTKTNDTACTGCVGEELTASTTVIATGLTSAAAKTATSVALTAGDWEVSGMVGFDCSAVTSFAYIIASISLTADTLGAATTQARLAVPTAAGCPGIDTRVSVPPQRVSIATTTTVYLVGMAGFTAGAGTAGTGGTIRARRFR